MITHWFVPSLVFFSLVSSVGPVEGASAEESRCRQWALEDGVPGKQVLDYVKKCAAELAKSTARESEAASNSQPAKIPSPIGIGQD